MRYNYESHAISSNILIFCIFQDYEVKLNLCLLWPRAYPSLWIWWKGVFYCFLFLLLSSHNLRNLLFNFTTWMSICMCTATILWFYSSLLIFFLWESVQLFYHVNPFAHGHLLQAVIVSCCGCFHGRTLAVISMSCDNEATRGFGPLLPGHLKVDFGDAEALERIFKGSGLCYILFLYFLSVYFALAWQIFEVYYWNFLSELQKMENA